MTNNHAVFRDVAGDSLSISTCPAGDQGLYLVGQQAYGDEPTETVALRFSLEDSLRIRQHILDLFPLEDVALKQEAGVLVESVAYPSPSITININSLTVNA